MKKKRNVFDVVGALIKNNHRFLLCKRMEKDHFGSMWEFPGGKVEMHEDKTKALRRELKEEIGVDVKVGRLINRFQDEIPEMKIYVYLYDCSIQSGVPRCIECQEMKWVTADESKDLKLAPADEKIARYLIRRKMI